MTEQDRPPEVIFYGGWKATYVETQPLDMGDGEVWIRHVYEYGREVKAKIFFFQALGDEIDIPLVTDIEGGLDEPCNPYREPYRKRAR